MTEFKEFRVGDLFEVKSGKQPLDDNRFDVKLAGMVNTITGATTNNGINFYSYSDTFYVNELTISKDGEYAGTVFLQTQPFILGGHVLGLFSKKVMTNKSKLYIATLISKYVNLWSSGDRASVKSSVLLGLTLNLPVTIDGSPDWKEMESVVDTVEQQHVDTVEQQHVDTVDKTLSAAGFSSYEDTMLTDEEQELLNAWMLAQTKSERSASAHVPFALSFKRFRLDQLFDIKLSNGDNKISSLKSGPIPLVSSGASNNGIVGYVSSNTILFNKNLITLDMFGNAFYQPNDFYTVSHGRVNVLVPKIFQDNFSEIALYMVTSINKLTQTGVYGFSNMLSSKSASLLEISLPINNSDQSLNFDLMNKLSVIFKKLSIQNLRNNLDKKLDSYKKQI